ncbi:hypothetical protein CSB45_15945 [candidate division KSB3 bacterium]|uniref:IraD/Gp25-like domain-containing protein n=1 Tax=candidate division KSB3 bacterium TaxID=2044937 RepID=A0A2G6E136_9BACT|nr:MAG: hypothetical protein CSB45_15945 [candidate division KSB3 bacterium]
MNKTTGRALSDIDHLQQSIADILLTPVGSRVMRRSYGSRLLELISQPYSIGTVLQIYTAIADALRQWEPRFTLKRIQPQWSNVNKQAEERQNGILQLVLNGDYLGESITVGVTV